MITRPRRGRAPPGRRDPGGDAKDQRSGVNARQTALATTVAKTVSARPRIGVKSGPGSPTARSSGVTNVLQERAPYATRPGGCHRALARTDGAPETAGVTRPREPGLFLNRDLSLLEYNARVLDQARDPRMPLLERLRAHVHVAENLDEFFEIRVAGLRQRAAQGLDADGPDGLGPRAALAAIGARAHALVEEQYRLLSLSLLQELEAHAIRIRRHGTWTPAERDWAGRYFAAQVAPLLTPIRLDPAHPFPRLHNRRLSFLVALRGQDAFGQRHDHAVATVQMPRGLPSLVQLPPSVAGAPHDFVLLSSFIHAFGEQELFGMEVTGCYPFRVTRNSDVQLDEVGPENLRQAVEEELLRRDTGEPVRLELVADCPDDLATLLLDEVGLTEADVYRVGGPVDLRRLEAIYQAVDRPELKHPPITPGVPAALRRGHDPFAAIRAEGELLLHHPFQSTQPVVDLLQQAAMDPRVRSIKQTLYRAAPDSPVVDALVLAAEAGKPVTVVVEVRARGSLDQNAQVAARLEEHGAQVLLGAIGRKAHAKLLLIERQDEDGQTRRYLHVGTGNYHPADPTQPWTDASLFTCDAAIGEDAEALFGRMAGAAEAPRPRALLTAPGDLRDRLVALVERAADAARAGAPARVALKTNALTDPAVIEALCRAAQAGARVDVVVRGMCALRPGLPGLSERVRVRSVLGRFHEHSRAIHVRAGDEETTLLTSADLTPRNLDRRVEVAVPVRSAALRARLEAELLATYLDAPGGWELLPDGTWRLVDAPEGPGAQERLLGRHHPDEPRPAAPPAAAA